MKVRGELYLAVNSSLTSFSIMQYLISALQARPGSVNLTEQEFRQLLADTQVGKVRTILLLPLCTQGWDQGADRCHPMSAIPAQSHNRGLYREHGKDHQRAAR